MKTKLLTAILLITLMFSARGQGLINWGNNFSGFRALIFAPDTANSTLSLSGQSGQFFGGTTTVFQDNPVGTQTYSGLLLSGTRYMFAVFAGSTGTLSNNLALLGQTTFNTSSSTVNGGNVLPKGIVPSKTDTLAGVDPGSQAAYQVRVWDTQNGTLTTWALAEQAWLVGSTAAAVSPMLAIGPLGGQDPGGCIIPAPNTTQFSSFNIYYTPEPGSFALLGMGAAAMLLLRRRK